MSHKIPDFTRPHRFQWNGQDFTACVQGNLLYLSADLGPLPFTAEAAGRRGWLIGETLRRRSGVEGDLALTADQHLQFSVGTRLDATDDIAVLSALTICLLQVSPYLALLGAPQTHAQAA